MINFIKTFKLAKKYNYILVYNKKYNSYSILSHNYNLQNNEDLIIIKDFN